MPTNPGASRPGPAPIALPAGYDAIRGGIVDLLQAARAAAARSVNALMTASYWEIGRRVVEAEQKGRRRAGYGERLIERLSADLTAQFGRGFSPRNIEQMRAFYSTWPIPQTPSAISGTPPRKLTLSELSHAFPLPWSAYVRLLSVENNHARKFYETEALRGGWSVRLRCLVLIDLKLAELTHADVGQMHMYCNYAKEHWTLPDENPPVGLILCAHKGHALARYALDGLPNKIMAANYKTVLPDAEVLEKELEKTRLLLEARRAPVR